MLFLLAFLIPNSSFSRVRWAYLFIRSHDIERGTPSVPYEAVHQRLPIPWMALLKQRLT
jgi:hypothetical protein